MENNNKVLNQMGLSNNDLEPMDKPKPLPEMPEHHKSPKGGITIDKGINKGSNYDNTTDYLHTEDAKDDSKMEKLAKNDLKQMIPNANEQEVNKAFEDNKEMFEQKYKEAKENSKLDEFFEIPEVKNKIISNYRYLFREHPVFNNQTDEQIWNIIPRGGKDMFWRMYKGGKK